MLSIRAFFEPLAMGRLAPRLAMLALSLCLAGILTPEAAEAGSPTCTITSTDVAFGNINVLAGTAIDVTATLSVSCTGGGGVGQRLCLSFGSGTSFSGSQRQLAGPSGATLKYELYKDASRTSVWGSWVTGFGGGSGLQLDVGQYSTTNITVYARLAAAQQTAGVGSYSTAFTAEPYLQYEDKGTTACPTGTKNTSTSTNVSATVLATCTVSATNMAFGSASVLTTNRDATSQITPFCNNGLPYSVGLNGGVSGATNPTLRKMSKSAEHITYGLYRDAARSLVWGSTAGNNTASGTGTGGTQTFTVYGRVPPQTTGSPGVYSDTVVVNVIY